MIDWVSIVRGSSRRLSNRIPAYMFVPNIRRKRKKRVPQAPPVAMDETDPGVDGEEKYVPPPRLCCCFTPLLLPSALRMSKTLNSSKDKNVDPNCRLHGASTSNQVIATLLHRVREVGQVCTPRCIRGEQGAARVDSTVFEHPGLSIAELINPDNRGIMEFLKFYVKDARRSGSPRATFTFQVVEEGWELVEVEIERGRGGLGVSVAGGTDSPHFPQDPNIYITKIIPNGAAFRDKRLRVNDVLLRVNDVDLVGVPHGFAVETLRVAGSVLNLLVKRRKTLRQLSPGQYEVELTKGDQGLGFSIAGGMGNQHIPGDAGIFVTKVTELFFCLVTEEHHEWLCGCSPASRVPPNLQSGHSQVMEGGAAAAEGTLEVGDRLVAVRNGADGEVSLENVTHEEAVAVLKGLRDAVVLVIEKPKPSNHHNPIDDDDREEDYGPVLFSPKTEATPNQLPDDRQPASSTHSPPQPSMESRKVVLQKGPNGLGFNIVGGEDDEGIFISYLLTGGVAEASGALKIGDQIIRPQKDDGLPSRGLPFTFGEILHVTNACDDEWWQAKRVLPSGSEGELGIIPSKRRWERKMRARDRTVKFQGKASGSISLQGSTSSLDRKKRITFSRKFPFMKSRDERGIGDEDSDLESTTVASRNGETGSLKGGEERILSYEPVERVEISFSRPVVILGPLKDRFNDDLISEFPDKFGTCVPRMKSGVWECPEHLHNSACAADTTRARREYEVDGQDYYFVPSREEMERDIQNHLFIEAGQYNENLYGTSVTAVRRVAENGKHCILDVSASAIRRLRIANLHPIAILIRPRSHELLMEWNKRTTEEQAKKQYERALKLEHDYLEYFSALVHGDTPEEVYENVKHVIDINSDSVIWAPKEKDKEVWSS
ncbi:unnamed protein product [Darwinula stevensoni]|uniref:Uncharacterized protein n=1 Tax=Darwinula stevensoni TaxID=69355 RepID=A0A7R8X969_9CRUS|nr:unnamed protein product [Darwinula stevensoni]CAG0888862.1 unnamed protein product [Darwinula stevensoni]